jgi:hypothetical protein
MGQSFPMSFRCQQSTFDESDVVLRCLRFFRGFLLEAVKYVDCIAETHCVDGAIGVPVKVLDNLQNTGMAKTFKWFGFRMFATRLREVQGISERALHNRGHAAEILSATGHPKKRLFKSV